MPKDSSNFGSVDSTESNVLLITVDTLRYKDISSEPYFRSFSEDKATFHNHISVGPGTSSAFPGILAGSLPMDHGYKGLNEEHDPLANNLSEQGVFTMGVSSSDHVSSLYGYDAGFDTFVETHKSVEHGHIEKFLADKAYNILIKNENVGKINKKLLSASDIYRKFINNSLCPYSRAKKVKEISLSKIKSIEERHPNRKKFFWIHFMEPHSPYFPPQEFISSDYSIPEVNALWSRWWENRGPVNNETNIELFSEDERRALWAYYKSQTRYVLSQIDQLLSSAEEILGDFTAIITSDHGEEFFEKGDLAHREKLIEELDHVPLWMYSSNTSMEKNIDQVTSHLDIPVTVSNKLNCDPSPKWGGEGLFNLFVEEKSFTRDHAISEICLIGGGFGGEVDPEKAIISVQDERFKLIVNNQDGSEKFLKLDGGIEQISDEVAPEAKLRFKNIVEDRLQSIEKKKMQEKDLSKTAINRLEKLGYT